jgi:hypothetical protein
MEPAVPQRYSQSQPWMVQARRQLGKMEDKDEGPRETTSGHPRSNYNYDGAVKQVEEWNAASAAMKCQLLSRMALEEQDDNWDDDFEEGISLNKIHGTADSNLCCP